MSLTNTYRIVDDKHQLLIQNGHTIFINISHWDIDYNTVLAKAQQALKMYQSLDESLRKAKTITTIVKQTKRNITFIKNNKENFQMAKATKETCLNTLVALTKDIKNSEELKPIDGIYGHLYIEFQKTMYNDNIYIQFEHIFLRSQELLKNTF